MFNSLVTQTTAPGKSATRKLILNDPDERRVSDIKDACASLVDGFQQFDSFVETYLNEVPQRTTDTDQSDCERFLRWLAKRDEVDQELRDIIVDQQSRHAVVFLALQKRIAHQRFLKLRQESKPFEKHSAKHLSEFVHINPVHVWATFETHQLLNDNIPVPATVLFYSTDDEVLTIVVDLQTARFLKQLEQGAQKLRSLIRQTPKPERDRLLDTIAGLIQKQVVAVG